MASSSARDLRIVLIGKHEQENDKVENIIKGTSVLDREAPSSCSQQHSERHIIVINTPHLLQPHLSQHQITQRVRECVSKSAPGPNVILLVLQYKDFSDDDLSRVIYVLNLFSVKAIKHTIVVTTDEETLTSKWASLVVNNTIKILIKQCEGRHLQFVTNNPGWRSEMIRRIEKMLKDEDEEFVIYNMYEDGGTSVDDPVNSDHKRSGQFNLSTKSGSGGGVTSSGKTNVNIVLCGSNTTLKNSVSKILRGITRKPHTEMSNVCVKREEKINGRQITVIELPALTRLSEEEVMRETLNCLILSDPGVDLFILVTPVGSLTNEDRAEMEKIKRVFNSNEHFMVLFTTDLTLGQSVSDCVLSTEYQKIVSLYGSWYSTMALKDNKNSGHISKILTGIDSLNTEPYSLQMYLRSQEKRVRDELEEKLIAKGSMKLNLVLCGNEKSLISNLLLNQSEKGSVLSSEFMRRQFKLHGRLINILELPAVTQISEEEVMRQTIRCVSLCDPGVHVFLLTMSDAPLNNEDRAEMEKIQKIFSSRINKHIMVLINQNSEDRTAELNEETQSVIQSFGGRHHFISPDTQVSVLMEILQLMVEENNGVCFSSETVLELQMEKLLKFEEINRRIHSQDSKEGEDDLRIVLLGKTGAGKSATGNTILGGKMFAAESSHESVTKVCKRERAEINGRHVTVIDTPGLFDTNLTNEEIQREIGNCITMTLPGPHVLLLIITLGRFTQEEEKSVKIIQEMFGEKSLMFTMVLFTRGDDLENKSIEQWLGTSGSALKHLIEECGKRYHVFNNKNTGDRTQVSDLLEKIDHMVKKNGDSYYSCKMFRKMERKLQEEEMKVLTDKVEKLEREREELIKKHEEEKKKVKMTMEEVIRNERKRREEEFGDREGRYKKDIKEREEQERKMREELNRERDEWEKQRREEKRRRDEEDERRRVKEQAMRDEYNQRLEQERERRVREKEDIQFKYKEENGKLKIMMKEFREREEQYKKDIKAIEDQERKIRKEMKTEREDWEKQKQEERQRDEEEKKTRRSNELYIGTPEDQDTNIEEVEEDSPSDPGCLRILLFGRTGNGKSATGNTILGKNEFHSEDKGLVTTVCQMGVGEVDGKSVAVVDTPGLFDSSMKNKQVQEEMMKCISLSAPGPHVFIIVLSLGRITQEKQDTLDVIMKIFGPKAADFSIVLFTKGDTLKEQKIEQYIENIKNDDLKKLISDCGDRFLAFNNQETRDRTQVTRLLKMIEEVKKSNEGRYFTNEIFEETAISIDKRREMLEQNKRQKQAQVKELEDKYDLEIKRMRQRLEKKKLNTGKERVRLEEKFREKEKTLRREFEEKEESDLKKRKEEELERSEEEEQRRAEYDQRIEEMETEIENQDEKQKKETEEREEKYRKDQEKMKTEHERIMAELRSNQEEEIKKRDLEEQMRKKQEEKEREEWKRKIKETEDDEDIQERIKRQQRDWEEEKKQQMREREEEERKRKERHEEQLKEKQEELEKFEAEREKEEEQMIQGERQKHIKEREEKEKEHEDKKTEMKSHYDQLEREREEEREKRKQEDEERQEEKRKRWEKMIEDLKRELEEEIRRREREERKGIEREEKECDKMKQKYNEEIEKMKKKHEDEARKQEEELNDFLERKKKHIDEFKGMLEEELNKVIKLREESTPKRSCLVM